jgi:hypothetical protein
MGSSSESRLERALLTLQTAAHFEELGGNPKKGFLVGGISAGGNFGTVVSHLYRDDELSPPLTGVYLSIPACMGPDVVPAKYKNVYLSREQNKNAPILNAESMGLFDSKSIPLLLTTEAYYYSGISTRA